MRAWLLNTEWADKLKYKFVDQNSGDFIDRIKVNYLRHRLTNYENELYKIHGKTGIADALMIVRKKVYLAIAEKYPHLKNECIDQLDNRGINDKLLG